MSYRIRAIELYVRETPPGRFPVVLGRAAQSEQAPEPTTNPIAHVRLILRGDHGEEIFGCAGDRLSVRWLDKRPERAHDQKLRGLVDLIGIARQAYLQAGQFDSPFDTWRRCHGSILRAGRARSEEELSCGFASALLERAMLDAVSRLEGRPLFQMVRENRLGFRAQAVHPELADPDFADLLPPAPLVRFSIRHTVGLADPLSSADVPPHERLDDGLPETLEEAIRRYGLRYFKLKISGDRQHDLERLGRIWDLLPHVSEMAVTLDANEAYSDLEAFTGFVQALRGELPGLFDHILYFEQPLPRAMSLDPHAAPGIRRIARLKPVILDEADSTVDAFKQGHALGYAGTSHKNCKGFFKSLLNHCLAASYRAAGRNAFLSGEDLQNLPIVPLHQDFVSCSILGLNHCERNGHHYNYGLSMLSAKEKTQIARHHADLYVRRGDEWFLNIQDGKVRCASLQCPGFGVLAEPDWSSMQDLEQWAGGIMG